MLLRPPPLSSTQTSSSSRRLRKKSTNLLDIPEALQLKILQLVSRKVKIRRWASATCYDHWLVHRRWSELLASTSFVRVKPWARLDSSSISHLLQSFPSARSLQFPLSSIFSLSDDLLHSIVEHFPDLLSLVFDDDCWDMGERGSKTRRRPLHAPTVTQAGVDALLSSCQNLLHLSLRGVGSMVLPESLGLLTTLKTLEVLRLHSSHALEDVSLPYSASSLRGLRSLSFESSTASLPTPIFLLQNLTSLSLMCPRVLEVPSIISCLTRLKSLTLQCSALSSLPQSFQLRTLSHLQMQVDSLTILPDFFPGMKSLRSLELKMQSLTSLPDSFTALIHLKKLHLHSCSSLTHLPPSIGRLLALADLKLVGCGTLQCLPEGFGNFPSLSKLSIEFCHEIHTLSAVFGNLPNLSWLKLTCLPQLASLSPTFHQLRKLSFLQIATVSITDLPSGFGDLVTLQHLCLSELTSLRRLESLESASSLTHLHIKECDALEKLPQNLGDLGNLTTLIIE